jgi:hypothetical protein
MSRSVGWESIPWVLVGDFIAIYFLDEKRGGGVMSWLLWQNDLFNHVWKILDSPALCLLGLISNVITLF